MAVRILFGIIRIDNHAVCDYSHLTLFFQSGTQLVSVTTKLLAATFLSVSLVAGWRSWAHRSLLRVACSLLRKVLGCVRSLPHADPPITWRYFSDSSPSGRRGQTPSADPVLTS